MMQVSFTIPGTPQQQGSKTKTPQGYYREDNRGLDPWRKDALAVLQGVRDQHTFGDGPRLGVADGPMFTGPVFVTMVAIWTRPASHYGTGRNAGVLKATAPFWKASAPDLDKVQRALGDVLTQSGVVLDDRLIVHWDPCKVWGSAALMQVTVADAEPIAGPSLTVEAEAVLL
jgi:crossover junction endodeoxyribonuclease RusA